MLYRIFIDDNVKNSSMPLYHKLGKIPEKRHTVKTNRTEQLFIVQGTIRLFENSMSLWRNFTQFMI